MISHATEKVKLIFTLLLFIYLVNTSIFMFKADLVHSEFTSEDFWLFRFGIVFVPFSIWEKRFAKGAKILQLLWKYSKTNSAKL